MTSSSTSPKKILFLGGDVADYLSIGVFNGLKQLPGIEVIDFPEAQIAYKAYKNKLQSLIRGGGFSLFFMNDETNITRFHLFFDSLWKNEFDVIIFADIQNNFGYFVQLRPYLRRENTIILDGADTAAIYPYHGYFWKKIYYWFLPKAHKKFIYFKREFTPDTIHYLYFKLLPKFLCNILYSNKLFFPISFSIPEEKIINSLPTKVKDFPEHIVDEEIAKFLNKPTKYAFSSEEEYYLDLQQSKFGITTKRSGWDCLRHYEIAANGTLICFKNLNTKPAWCAPHGLIDGYNCISYKDFADLRTKVENLDEKNYKKLQYNCWLWAKEKSCTNISKYVLDILDKINH